MVKSSSRAYAFQSRKRRSSPATYSRKFSGSMPAPWIRPRLRRPARIVRARLVPSTRPSSRSRKSGSNARVSSISRLRLLAHRAHSLYHLLHDSRRINVVGMGRIVKHDAMFECGRGDLIDIVVRDVGAPVEQRLYLGAQDERLRATRARTKAYVAICRFDLNGSMMPA